MPARIVVPLLAIAALLAGTQAAHAREGSITAASSADWNTVSFTGSATWDTCPPEDCLWQPYVTTQPASTPCQMEAPYPSGDPNVRVVWAGETEEAPATVTFTVSGAPLIPGLVGQKLCLIGQGAVGAGWFYAVLASRLIDGPAPPPPPSPPVVRSAPSATCTKARAARKRAKRRLEAALRQEGRQLIRKRRIELRRANRRAKQACA